MLPNSSSLSVIIPVYNEVNSIGAVVDSLVNLRNDLGWEIIVVNDGSDDGTDKEIERFSQTPGVKLIHHPYNKGYGAAIKTGIKQAAGKFVATMDGDGQHSPEDLFKLLAEADQYDMVIGARMGLVHSPFWRMPGKWLLGWLASYLECREIPDLNSGLRLFRKDVIVKYLHLCPDGFSFSTTITLILLNRNYNLRYVPIEVHRRQGKSNVSVATGFEALILILRIATLLEPLKVFLPPSLFLLMLGVLWGVPYAVQQRGVSVGALLLFLSGLITFFFGLLADQVSQLRKERFE